MGCKFQAIPAGLLTLKYLFVHLVGHNNIGMSLLSLISLRVMLCVTGDGDEDHDTVQQLQEVIEQLRNVFPSEPGESLTLQT